MQSSLKRVFCIQAAFFMLLVTLAIAICAACSIAMVVVALMCFGRLEVAGAMILSGLLSLATAFCSDKLVRLAKNNLKGTKQHELMVNLVFLMCVSGLVFQFFS